jgi:hypothetical protein
MTAFHPRVHQVVVTPPETQNDRHPRHRGCNKLRILDRLRETAGKISLFSAPFSDTETLASPLPAAVSWLGSRIVIFALRMQAVAIFLSPCRVARGSLCLPASVHHYAAHVIHISRRWPSKIPMVRDGQASEPTLRPVKGLKTASCFLPTQVARASLRVALQIKQKNHGPRVMLPGSPADCLHPDQVPQPLW